MITQQLWLSAVVLMALSAVMAWSRSRLVAFAIGLPAAANVVVAVSRAELAINHPARIVVPIVSAVVGFAELLGEASRGRRGSRPALMGCTVFASGALDVFALPMSSVIQDWVVLPLQFIASAVLFGLLLVPERGMRWVSSALA